MDEKQKFYVYNELHFLVFHEDNSFSLMFAMFLFTIINRVGIISPFQGYVGRVLFFKILTSLWD